MHVERAAVLLTVVAVVAVGVVTGPMVSGADRPADASIADLHGSFGRTDGSVSVDRRLAFASRGLPADGSLVAADDGHALRVGPASLIAETGSRPATVRYALDVPALNYSNATTRTVAPDTERRLRVLAPDGPVDARVENDSYTATLTLTITADGATYTVDRTRLRLEVRG